jgi:hypothetical protein
MEILKTKLHCNEILKTELHTGQNNKNKNTVKPDYKQINKEALVMHVSHPLV